MAPADHEVPVVPVHAEQVPEVPLELLWVMPPGTLAFVGALDAAPAPLQALLDDGTVVALAVEPTAVRLRLAEGRSWREEGDRVRRGLQAALATPCDWVPAVSGTSDDVVRMAARQVIDGEVGDYIRGHGGQITLLQVDDGRVEVALSGACAHCPAADFTLTERFERALRARCPAVREVTSRTAPGVAAGRRLLGLLAPRRS